MNLGTGELYSVYCPGHWKKLHELCFICIEAVDDHTAIKMPEF